MSFAAYLAIQLFLALLIALYGVGLIYHPCRFLLEGPFRKAMLRRNADWLLLSFAAWLASDCVVVFRGMVYGNDLSAQLFFLLTSLQLLPIAVLTMGYPNRFLRDSIFEPTRLETIAQDQWAFSLRDRLLLIIVFSVLLFCQLLAGTIRVILAFGTHP